MLEKKEYAAQCAEMIEKQLRRRGVIDVAVLVAMTEVPRHEFLPAELRSHAYDDLPLLIGGGQTISQPYIVAAMTAALHLQAGDRVLEIGTGCGYQAAVLSRLAREVFSIERRPELASGAATKLAQLGRSARRKLRRSEEHTSELQSPYDLVCRLLPEKKKLSMNTQTCST